MATHSSQFRQRLTKGEFAHSWLAIALFAVALVTAAYVLTHEHPAYEGGLYLMIIEQIQTHGYALPVNIPFYTTGGIPFAYPPFMFYLNAIILDLTGIDPVWYTLVFPAAMVVAYLVPFYLLAKDFLVTSRRAGFATLLFGVAPPVLRWHLSAGGIIRAPTMLVTLVGIYTGIRLFRTGERRWLVASTVLWAIVLASHPVYTVFFGWTYLLYYLVTDRSLLGLVRGATVAIGGLALAAPWWLLVGARHGMDIFLLASNSRSSLGGGMARIMSLFVWPVTDVDIFTLFYVLAFAGTIYALYRRRIFLSLWLITASYLIGTPRFTFVAGSMVASLFVFEVLVPAARRAAPSVSRRRKLVAGGIALLVALSSTGVGMAFAGSQLNTAHQTSTTLPETVDQTDIEAANWAQANTDPSASFMVLGDSAEWFPYYADRTIQVSPWGTEWTDRFHLEGHLMKEMSLCSGVACLEENLHSTKGTPKYLYVPTSEFTVRGKEYQPRDQLITDLRRSEDYHLRYSNGGVMIFEVDTDPWSIAPGSSAASQQQVGYWYDKRKRPASVEGG